MDAWSFLLEIVVLLAACLFGGAIASRLGQSPLVGYLLAGTLIGGPGSLELVHSQRNIDALAELGVALLLFDLGLEFSWRQLRALGNRALIAGFLQVIVTAAVIAVFAMPSGTLQRAIALGAMLALSSTAAVVRVLYDKGEVDSLHGRNAVAVLLVQDMWVVPLAVLVGTLGSAQGPADAGRSLLLTLAVGAGLAGVMWLLLSKVVVRVFQALARFRPGDLVTLLAVVLGLASAWAAHAAGLSPAIGAFMAGMFLASTPFATQIRADISPLRVVLLTMFFGAAGMIADPSWIVANAGLVAAGTVAIIAGKVAIVWGLLRLLGFPHGVAVATGLCLAQVGEFAFVLGSSAVSTGVLAPEAYMPVVSVAITTLLATPYLIAMAPRAGAAVERWLGNPARDAAAGTKPPPDLIIVGFGPAGEAVGRALTGQPVRALVIDRNPAMLRRAQAMGLEVMVGNAELSDVLNHARVAEARVVVITLPSPAAALPVLVQTRRLAPQALTIVRSRYEIQRKGLLGAGADVVVGDESEVGKALATAVVGQLERSSGQNTEGGSR